MLQDSAAPSSRLCASFWPRRRLLRRASRNRSRVRAAALSKARLAPMAAPATKGLSTATSRWARWRSSSRRANPHRAARYNLQSPVGLIRMMIQQSNCFIVVERGVGMRNMMQERQLASAGEMRQGSNIGGGQMVAADFILTPAVVFSENNAGGIGGAVGGLLGRKICCRRGRRRPEVQGSADEHAGRRLAQRRAGRGGRGQHEESRHAARWRAVRRRRRAPAAGGYGNTNEGKIIAAAFMDNYNNVVKVVRNDSSLQRSVGSLKEEAAAGGKTNAAAGFNEGDVLVPKIANVKLLADAADTAKVVRDAGERRRTRHHRRREKRLHPGPGSDRHRMGQARARSEALTAEGVGYRIRSR